MVRESHGDLVLWDGITSRGDLGLVRWGSEAHTEVLAQEIERAVHGFSVLNPAAHGLVVRRTSEEFSKHLWPHKLRAHSPHEATDQLDLSHRKDE